MKRYKNLFLTGLAALGVVFAMSSCQKSFDLNSYKPSKPLPSYGGYSASKEIEPASLLDYFNFNGTLADSLKNLSGTASGTSSFGTGVSGKAYQGAVGSYVVFGDVPIAKSLTSFTISFWMNSPRTNGLARGVFSLNNPTDFWGGLDIYLDNPPASDPKGDTLIFKVHMNNVSGVPYGAYFLSSQVPNAINIWTHMVVTYDATSSVINFYQNGAAIGVSGVAGTSGYVKGPTMPGSDPSKTPVTPWGPLKLPSTKGVLGTWQFQTNPSLTASATAQTWAESYVGLLDNFRIYDTALSAVEVSALFNLEKAGR